MVGQAQFLIGHEWRSIVHFDIDAEHILVAQIGNLVDAGRLGKGCKSNLTKLHVSFLRSDAEHVVDEIDAVLHKNDDDGVLLVTMRLGDVLGRKFDGNYLGVRIDKVDVVTRFLLHFNNVFLGAVGVGPRL